MFNFANKKGFLLAFATAGLWGLYAVLMKIGVVCFENLHPFVFMSALMQVIQVKIAENHKQNNLSTGSIHSELRVTGFVTAISSLIYMAFIFLVIFLEIKIESIVPTYKQLIDLNSLVYASIVGLLVVSLNKYLILTATKSVGSTNFLTIVAFTPLFTIIFEHLCFTLKILETPSFNIYEVSGGILVIFSVLFITSHSVKGIKLSNKEKENLKEAKELINCCDIHFKNNSSKIIKSLKINKSDYKNIKQLNDFVVSNELLNKIKHNFNNSVALSDSLTGLQSRVKFLSKVNNLDKRKTASVIFIDLNKFKPVNDTYGHKAGDEILQKTALRLKQICKEVTRLESD